MRGMFTLLYWFVFNQRAPEKKLEVRLVCQTTVWMLMLNLVFVFYSAGILLKQQYLFFIFWPLWSLGNRHQLTSQNVCRHKGLIPAFVLNSFFLYFNPMQEAFTILIKACRLKLLIIILKYCSRPSLLTGW